MNRRQTLSAMISSSPRSILSAIAVGYVARQGEPYSLEREQRSSIDKSEQCWAF